jgi:hypothetical protein
MMSQHPVASFADRPGYVELCHQRGLKFKSYLMMLPLAPDVQIDFALWAPAEFYCKSSAGVITASSQLFCGAISIHG